MMKGARLANGEVMPDNGGVHGGNCYMNYSRLEVESRNRVLGAETELLVEM